MGILVLVQRIMCLLKVLTGANWQIRLNEGWTVRKLLNESRSRLVDTGQTRLGERLKMRQIRDSQLEPRLIAVMGFATPSSLVIQLLYYILTYLSMTAGKLYLHGSRAVAIRL